MEKKQRHPFEIRLSLELDRSELVRTFVREAALLEGARPALASLVAEDANHAFTALCALAPVQTAVNVAVSSSRGDIHCRILMRGHASFAPAVESLGGFLRQDAGLSIHERGVDGWELGFRRRIAQDVDASDLLDGPTPEAPAAPERAAEDIRIDLPSQDDAPAIARCFLEVYGRNYVHAEVFSPQRYWSKVESGELIPVVARNGKGEAVGHVALEREPGAVIAERGQAVVLNAYRGRHLLERMTERLSQEAVELGLSGVYALPVTIHTFSQRNDERAGMPVCAALLGAARETLHPKGAAYPTAGQRQSLLMAFRFLTAQRPRAIHAPEPYRAIMLRIYESLGVDASALAPAEPAAANSKTRISIDSQACGKIHFEQIGAAAGIELAQAFRDLRGLGARAVQLLAPVADPGLPLLTEEARALGFFFCGVGPAFLEGADALMLQFLEEPLDVGKLQIFTDAARDLVSFIDRDRSASPRIVGTN